MICKKCGRNIGTDVNFCGFCGSYNAEANGVSFIKTTKLKDELKRNRLIFLFSVVYFVVRVILLVLSFVFVEVMTNSFLEKFLIVSNVLNSLVYGLFLGGFIVAVHTFSRKIKCLYLFPHVVFIIAGICVSLINGIDMFASWVVIATEMPIFVAIVVATILQKSKFINMDTFKGVCLLVLITSVLHGGLRVLVNLFFYQPIYLLDEYIMIFSALVVAPIGFYQKMMNSKK